jgi:hypothetical protein
MGLKVKFRREVQEEKELVTSRAMLDGYLEHYHFQPATLQATHHFPNSPPVFQHLPLLHLHNG